MKIVVTDRGIPAKSVFKLVWTGYTVGTGVIFLPFGLLAALAAFFFEGGPNVIEVVRVLLLVPFGIAIQGLALGVIVMFGLYIYRSYWKIQVLQAEA